MVRYPADKLLCSVQANLAIHWIVIDLALVVRKVENAIHRINHYPAVSVVCSPMDGDFSGG